LMEYAEQLGITLFWTPSEDATVDMCISLEPDFIKIAHTHYRNEEMAAKVAESNIRAIVSYPMGEQYNPFLWGDNARHLCCINQYPPPDELLWGFEFDRYCAHGVSLHSPFLTPYIGAALRGADIIEVHVKQNNDCIDSSVSLSLEDFAVLKRELDFIWN